QQEAVERHQSRERRLRLARQARRQALIDRRASERIHDRQQRADREQHGVDEISVQSARSYLRPDSVPSDCAGRVAGETYFALIAATLSVPAWRMMITNSSCTSARTRSTPGWPNAARPQQ